MFFRIFFFSHIDAQINCVFHVHMTVIFLCIMHLYVKRLYSVKLRGFYGDKTMPELSLNSFFLRVQILGNRESDIARDEMPEAVLINLHSDDVDSMTDTASENEDDICTVL